MRNADLTQKEFEVARVAATLDGSVKDVAAACGISLGTCKKYLVIIYGKLGVAGRKGLRKCLTT